jgi:hypothetical protein
MFAGFLDDAAVFPPGNATVRDAVPAHRSYHSAWYQDLVGPFVFPVARLGELVHGGHDLDGVVLSVTTPAASLPEALAAPVPLAAVEVVPDGDVAELIARLDVSLPESVIGYIEVPRGEQRDHALDAIAGTRYRAKFRTGGTVPHAHPGERELAQSLRAAVTRNVPFKCTAGLHHAVRHTDGDLEQHGFLNVLRATHALQQGASADEAAAILADREPPPGLARDVVAAARTSFVCFGTCSVIEPVADLVALELINVDGLRPG